MHKTSHARPSKNVIAQWFRASEATGDLVSIRYGHKSADSEEIQWSFISHCECDGIGGFAQLLRKKGAHLPALPKTNYPNRKIFRSLWNFWRRRSPSVTTATRKDWALATKQTTHCPEPPQAVAWHLFTEEQTARLRRACRNNKVTVNSLLLKQLDQAVRPSIKRPEAAIPWMIPVNLRGDVTYNNDIENHVSCVEPLIAVEDSQQTVQDKIHTCLEHGEHRANYLLLCIGKMLSHTMRMRVIKKTRSKPKGNIGAFSNLGVWDSEKSPRTSDAWFFCPPVCAGQLLSAGCVTFQNQLSLTLQTHPNLQNKSQLANSWMKHWVRSILSIVEN